MVSVIRMDIKKLVRSPKFYLVILFTFYFLTDYSRSYDYVMQETGLSMTPWLYPIYYSDWFNRLYELLVIIILLSNAPFADKDIKNILLRTTKGTWALSRIVYLFVLSVIGQIVFFMVSILVFVPNIGFNKDWGDVVRTVAGSYTGDEISIGNPAAIVDIVERYTPWKALVLNMVLAVLVSMVLGLVVMILNGLFKNSIGTVSAIILVTADFFMNLMSGFEKWKIHRNLQIMSWVNLESLSWTKISGKLLTGEILVILAVSILLLSGIFYVCVRKNWISVTE